MKRYSCECCGGTIDLRTGRCDYCGTQYRIENEQVFRIETYNSPTETISASVNMSNADIYYLGPEKASEIAIREIAHKLSEGIAHNIMFYTNFDTATSNWKFRGDLKVIVPINNVVSVKEMIGGLSAYDTKRSE